MATIRELITRLGYSVDDKNLKKYESSIANVKDKILSIQGLLTGAVAYGFYKLIDSSIAYGEELRKASQITGIAVDKLEKLRIGAGLAEVDVSTLSASLNIFSSNLANAQRGSKSDLDIFQRLGINPKGIKSVDDGLAQVSEKFVKMEDGIKKTALAREIFGRGGAELIPLLNNYKNMLGEYTDVINAFSMNSTKLKQFTDDSDDIGDRFQIIGVVIKKLKIEFAAGLYPAIKKAQQAFLKFLTDNRESILKGIEVAIKAITFAFEVLGHTFDLVWYAGKRLFKDIKWIFENSMRSKLAGFLTLFIAMRAIPPILTAIGVAARFMFGALGGWFGIAVIAIVAAVDDLIAYLNGEGSVIGAVAKWLEDPTFEKLPEKFKTMFNKIKDYSKGLLDSFREIPWVKQLREDTANFIYENDPIVMKQKADSKKLDDILNFKENVVGLGKDFDLLGEGNFADIVNSGNSNLLNPTTPSVEQKNEIKIDIKIDGTNPEMTPEKIGEKVKEGTQAAMDKILRETSSAFPFTESRFA